MPQIKKQSPVDSPIVYPQALDDYEKKILAKLKPINTDGPLKVLVYGWSGTGKTTFLSTFPGPIASIVRSGLNSPGEMKSLNTPELKKKIRQFDLENTDEMRGLIKILERDNSFKTVALDNATGLHDLSLIEILGWKELPAQNSWGLIAREKYQLAVAKTKELLRALLNLEKDVVIIAQERDFKNEENADKFASTEFIVPHIGAALSPSLVEWLNPACDYIVETFIRAQRHQIVKARIKEGDLDVEIEKPSGTGYDYCLRTGASDLFTTKFRVPRGYIKPEVIVDPTYDKFMKIINGEQV